MWTSSYEVSFSFLCFSPFLTWFNYIDECFSFSVLQKNFQLSCFLLALSCQEFQPKFGVGVIGLKSFSGLLPGVGVCPWWCHICRQGPKCPKSSKILSSSQQDVCYIHPRTAYTSSHKKDPLLRGKWLLVLLLGVTASEISTSHKIMKQQEWSKTQRAIQMLHICTDNEC